jgi:hypothetical protein
MMSSLHVNAVIFVQTEKQRGRNFEPAVNRAWRLYPLAQVQRGSQFLAKVSHLLQSAIRVI